MVPSSVTTVATDGERLMCDGFSLSETIHFVSLEFMADCFDDLGLSPRRDGLDAIVMGSTRSRPSYILRPMIGDSIEEFHMTSDREAGFDLPSPRRHCVGASPAPPQPYHGRRALQPLRLWRRFPRGRWHRGRTSTSLSSDSTLIKRGSEHKPTLSHPAPSRRHYNSGMS
jgi:hypothetical protein